LAATRSSALTALATLLIFAACNPGTAPSGDGQAHLAVRADVSGTAVATVVVEVSAADITTPLVFNFIVSGGVASGSITIPAGTGRTITIRAFDAGGVETHEGATTVNVQSGSNPTISVALTPLTGQVPIQATLGSVVITVTAATSTTLSLAGTHTVELTAAIVDAQGGHPTNPVVLWATHDPGVASVSASTPPVKAVVTGVGVGTTTIYATFQGAVGSAAITVGP
jgi:hypothetical protein